MSDFRAEFERRVATVVINSVSRAATYDPTRPVIFDDDWGFAGSDTTPADPPNLRITVPTLPWDLRRYDTVSLFVPPDKLGDFIRDITRDEL